MSNRTPQWKVAVSDTVTVSSRSTAISADKHYRISASIDIWFKVAATSGSITAASAAHFLKAGGEALIIVPLAGQSVYYIRVGSADGVISVGEVEV